MTSFYVSTPIYYVNGSPHIGHAYTTIAADTLARYHRLLGHDVFFMTGTDEHGLKVQRAAEKQGVTPQQLADENSQKFKDLFDRFNITYDRYIRTTEAEHTRVVQELYIRMLANDDIYLDKYEGWYAAADEAFYDESEIQDGKSIETGADVEWVEEESYFFRLSKFQEPLLKWYKENPDCIRPESRYNEVVSFVEGGLQDLSISRTTFDWGIPVPNDPKHVLYVWVDALTNYITGVGAFSDDENWEKFWPCNLHILGKDILRFHAVYWPAFLLSGGVELPEQLFIHGWWLVEGEKMSKRAGNWLDPHQLADQYALDLLRYYMLREIPFGNDGNFANERVIARNNAELADNFGNLVNRTTRMVESFVQGEIKKGQSNQDDAALEKKASDTIEEVHRAMDAREFHKALEAILSLSSELNLYLHNNQPWKLKKDETQIDRLNHVLYQTIEGIRWVATLLLPFVPDAANKVLDAFQVDTAFDSAEHARSFASLEWGSLPDGHTISSPEVLFAKLELPASEEEEKKKPSKKAQKKQEAKEEKKEKPKHIKFQDFEAVELRVGKVLEASQVEGSDKLLLLKVDVGEDEPRQIVAGIGKTYAPEDLLNNHYAVVTNLKPAKIFKIRSEGMMLAADTTDGKLSLANFPDTVAPGTRIG